MSNAADDRCPYCQAPYHSPGECPVVGVALGPDHDKPQRPRDYINAGDRKKYRKKKRWRPAGANRPLRLEPFSGG